MKNFRQGCRISVEKFMRKEEQQFNNKLSAKIIANYALTWDLLSSYDKGTYNPKKDK